MFRKKDEYEEELPTEIDEEFQKKNLEELLKETPVEPAIVAAPETDLYRMTGETGSIYLLASGIYPEKGEILSLTPSQAVKLLADGLVQRLSVEPE